MKLNRKNLRKLILEEMISIKNISLIIHPSLERCIENKDLIEDFCNFCARELDIEAQSTIEIVADRESNNVKTTAYYDPSNHDIVIYGKNRAIVDICRSIAHEMTHMSQMLEDRIEFPVQDAGGHIEDEANARAGEIVKLFAKSGKNRKSIYENLALKK